MNLHAEQMRLLQGDDEAHDAMDIFAFDDGCVTPPFAPSSASNRFVLPNPDFITCIRLFPGFISDNPDSSTNHYSNSSSPGSDVSHLTSTDDQSFPPHSPQVQLDSLVAQLFHKPR